MLDGEVVAFDGDGATDFGRLQQRMHVADRAEARRRAAECRSCYVVFDLLHLDGIDTMPLPYVDRRRLLSTWWSRPVVVGAGPPASATAPRCSTRRRAGAGGSVAKRLDCRYEPGRRSPAWRKVKVRRRQELVVGGWTPGRGQPAGSLWRPLVGYHADDDRGGPLRVRRHCRHRLRPRRAGPRPALLEAHRATGPVPRPAAEDHPGRALGARLVVEVEFAEWTSEGRMRHPAYLGQRIDKEPSEVVREPG